MPTTPSRAIVSLHAQRRRRLWAGAVLASGLIISLAPQRTEAAPIGSGAVSITGDASLVVEHRGGGARGGEARREGGGMNRGAGNVNRNVNRDVNRNVNRGGAGLDRGANVERGGAVRRGVAGGAGGAFAQQPGRNLDRGLDRRPDAAGWRRPASYWWPAGGAITAGAAIGYVSASAATVSAGAAPGPGYCWFYTDANMTQGFWDTCPQ